MSVAILTSLEKKGVKFKIDGERLRWTAPEGAIQSSDVTALRAAKWAVLAFMKSNAAKDEDKWFQFEERAAICEFDGNMTRAEAEERALKEVFS